MFLGLIVEDVYRTDGRRVLAGLIRLAGDIDAAEDALQEGCARALSAWQRDGVPRAARADAVDRCAEAGASFG